MREKTESTNEPSIITRGPFPDTGLPELARSHPFEYLAEFRTACKRLKPGQVMEFDSKLITEHRARKYLGILAGESEEFRGLVLRTGTATDGGRRRVFVAREKRKTIIVESIEEGKK